MTPKNHKKDVGFYILIALIVLAVILLLSTSGSVIEQVSYSEVRQLFQTEKVESFTLEGDTLTLKLREPYEDTGKKEVSHELFNVSIFYTDLGDLISQQLDAGILKEYNYNEGFTWPWWASFIPYLLIMGVFFIVWIVMMNRAGGNGGAGGMAKFGHAHTRLASEEKKKVTFADVAGADEEKAELEEIVDFLRNPQKYIELGARIPKGVLLVGPPGTGKTLIAKAVAGEAGVQFLSISGSDFVELYVGIGASRVRDLFEQAKKVAPAIVFIDEIDAVGRQRGTGLGGGHDEREQTLNQLLVEMDGFNNNDGVIVMAATNRADILDNALLRPGRFDRTIYVGAPDIKGREEILKVHARNKILSEDVDLHSVARGTSGFTGADLENLLNEAALLSARKNKKFISMAELDEAALKVMAGPEKKSRVVTDHERKLTAYHEAGHAVAAFFLEHMDPVHFITIIPRGQAGGLTLYRPEEDESGASRSELFERIVSALGGRVSEELFLEDISTGASADISQASSIARAMVTKYGMSDKLGPISYDSSSHSVFIGRDFANTKSYSEKIAAEIDDEVIALFDKAQARCREILSEHSDLVHQVAEYLLENESMDADTFRMLCTDGHLPEAEAPAAAEADVPAPTFLEAEPVPEPVEAEEVSASGRDFDSIFEDIRSAALDDARRAEIQEKQQTSESDAEDEDDWD